MKGNYIAKNMHVTSRASVHKSVKDLLLDDDNHWIEEGLEEYKEEVSHDKPDKET